MVVTGDRDAYQLVGEGVRIMTTSRGITDTKVYDREGVIDRYGIPPELIPDFIGLKGDTSDNIPGVPGIGDKTASELLQRFGDLETVLASVDQISGAKRKQNLTEYADAARLSKQLATIVYDVPIELDLEAEVTRRPDRAGLREIFREWELRDPLRRLEEALEDGRHRGDPAPRAAGRPHRPGAPRPAGGRRHARRRAARARRARARDRRGRADPARGALALRRLRRRLARAGGRGRRPRRARRRRQGPPGRRPRRQGARRRAAEPRLRHRGRRLPARSRPPRLPARRAVPRSAGWRSTPRTTRPRCAVLVHTLAERQARADQRARARAPARGDRAAARPRPARVREAGHQARHRQARGVRHPHPRRRRPARARDLGAGGRGVRDRLAPAARPHPVREARPQPQAPRQDRLLAPTPACCRRSAASTRSSPRSSASGSSRSSPRPTSTRCPPGSATTAACTRPSTRSRPPPAACRASTRTSRTSRSAPRPAARSAPASSPSRATC